MLMMLTKKRKSPHSTLSRGTFRILHQHHQHHQPGFMKKLCFHHDFHFRLILAGNLIVEYQKVNYHSLNFINSIYPAILEV